MAVKWHPFEHSIGLSNNDNKITLNNTFCHALNAVQSHFWKYLHCYLLMFFHNFHNNFYLLGLFAHNDLGCIEQRERETKDNDGMTIASYVDTAAVNFGKAHSRYKTPLIARFMGPTWGPSGADRTQVGNMLAPWTLLSGIFKVCLM